MSTTPNPNESVPSDSDLLTQNEQLRKQLREIQSQLQYAELKIQVLEERLRLERIAKYGPASEKLSDAQLELLELEPGVSQAEVEAESGYVSNGMFIAASASWPAGEVSGACAAARKLPLPP